MSGVPGIDVSRWQKEINWSRVAAAGYRFAVIRATIGNYYTDPRFYVNWDGAGEAGLLVSAYHVVAPEKPADSQMGRFFDVLDGRSGDLPLVLDVELSREVSPENITASVQACADRITEEDGRNPIIYTARWFWNRHVLSEPDWAEYDLWVAHYGVDAPSLPCGWDEWTFWQHSDHGQVPGISAATDLNRFNGTYEELLDYAESEADTVETPLTGLTETPLAGLKARVTVESLTVRSGPDMNYGAVGELGEGDLVNVVSLSGDDIWIQVEPGKWAPFRSQGERYMELE
jgi:lysozyme